MSALVTNIPAIMRARGWTQGATLMDRWFAGKPAAMPSYAAPDTTTISMNWVLSFKRALVVYDLILRDAVWSAAAAKLVMIDRFKKRHMVNNCFDFTSLNPVDLHDIHVNHRQINSYPIIDGLTAALGNFSLYVVPLTGQIGLLNGKFTIELYSVGIMVVDSYDFEGFQILGFWDAVTNRVSMTPFLGASLIQNDTFRNYRNTHKAGGDFRVYSDIKVTKFTKPFFISLIE